MNRLVTVCLAAAVTMGVAACNQSSELVPPPEGYGSGMCDQTLPLSPKLGNTGCADNSSSALCKLPLCTPNPLATDVPRGGTLPDGGALQSAIWSSADVLPNGSTYELCRCGQGTETVDTKRMQVALGYPQGLLSDSGTLLGPHLKDIGQFYSDCKARVRGDGQFYADPIGCSQIGFSVGIMADPPVYDLLGPDGNRHTKQPLGGQNHDGDDDPSICPLPNSANHLGSGFQLGPAPTDVKPYELRTAEQAVEPPEAQMIETPWCRWYGAPIRVAAETDGGVHNAAVDFCTFRPNAGDLVAAAGDYIIDGAHSELHEARILASVRPEPAGPRVRAERLTEVATA